MEYNIEFLEWDSIFFSKKIGRVTINAEDKLKIKDKEFFDLIYVFSENADLSFPLVDSKIVYIIDDLQNFDTSMITEDISFYNEDLDVYDELLALTLQSGEYSRFRLDLNFKDHEYEKLYKEWIDQSIKKKLATNILIEKINGKIVGFVTLAKKSNDLADISLVAVDRNYRGRGIAKKLIHEAIHLAKFQKYKKIQVVTQLNNSAANTLYSHAGFKKHSLTYIYHVWNYDTI